MDAVRCYFRAASCVSDDRRCLPVISTNVHCFNYPFRGAHGAAGRMRGPDSARLLRSRETWPARAIRP
jgi:hypothetical protein